MDGSVAFKIGDDLTNFTGQLKDGEDEDQRDEETKDQQDEEKKEQKNK